MSTFLTVLVSGLALGSISALVALGFLVVYKATGVINFAQGGLVTLAGFLGFWLVVQLGAPWWLSYPTVLILMFLVGVVMQRVIHAPLRHRSELVIVIASLGVGLAIEAILFEIYGPGARSLPPVLSGVVTIFGARISVYDLLIIGVMIVAVALLTMMFNRTQLGRQFRAASLDPETAALQGIPVKLFAMFAFGLGGLLAGVGGLMLAPRSTLNVNIGFTAMLLAFAAAVIGGFGGFGGVIVGALLLGLVQQMGAHYLAHEYREVYPFALMILAIAIAPRGILGGKSRVRV